MEMVNRRQVLAGAAGALLANSEALHGADGLARSQTLDDGPTPCTPSQLPKELRAALDRYNAASNAFMHGDPSLIQEAYSHCEDVTIFGGFGGYEHGWKKQVEKRFEWAAARFHGGETKTENISLFVSPDLACSVDLEHERSQLVGVGGTVQVDLRVTTVFRREGSQWRIVHRHADPLVKVQDAASIVRK